MQPTADINQKGLPSSDLASLGHLSRLPARSALLPAAEASTGRPRPRGKLFACKNAGCHFDRFYNPLRHRLSAAPPLPRGEARALSKRLQYLALPLGELSAKLTERATKTALTTSDLRDDVGIVPYGLQENTADNRVRDEIQKQTLSGFGRTRSAVFSVQFLKLWIGAGMRPPRLTNAAQETFLTGMIGA